jgi:hypothetical protein
MAVPVAGAAVGPARCRRCHHAAGEEAGQGDDPGGAGTRCGCRYQVIVGVEAGPAAAHAARSAPIRVAGLVVVPIVGWLVHRVPPSFLISVQRPAIVTGVLLPPLSTEDMDGVALSSRGTPATTLGSRSRAPACGGRLHDPRDGLQADAARARAA